jgi:hypothetical protein
VKQNLNSKVDVDSEWSLDHFEHLIFSISKKFAEKHSIEPYELKDLQQYVRLRLLEKLNDIQKGFKGECQIKTYIYAVLLNFCREFRKKNCSKSIWQNSDTNEELTSVTDAEHYITKDLHIAQEINRFNVILIILGSQAAKILLALKVLFEQKITYYDLVLYSQNRRLSLHYLKKLNGVEKRAKGASIVLLTQIFNDVEPKNSSVDSTRKWVERKTNHIIDLMNTGNKTHDKESLSILMEIKSNIQKDGKGNI